MKSLRPRARFLDVDGGCSNGLRIYRDGLDHSDNLMFASTYATLDLRTRLRRDHQVSNDLPKTSAFERRPAVEFTS